LSPETVFAGLNLVDRELSRKSYKKSGVKLLAMASIFTASKLHETTPLTLDEIYTLGNCSFTKAEILNEELRLLTSHCWNFGNVSSYNNMQDYVAALQLSQDLKDKIRYNAQVVLDFALCDYNLLSYTPTTMALASIRCAFQGLQKSSQDWAATLKYLQKNGFSIKRIDIMDCYSEMQKAFTAYEESANASESTESAGTCSPAASPQKSRSPSPTGVADLKGGDTYSHAHSPAATVVSHQIEPLNFTKNPPQIAERPRKKVRTSGNSGSGA